MQNYTLRIKGFVQTKTGWFKIDSVGDFLECKEIVLNKRDVIAHTKLVFIGKDEWGFENELIYAWKEHSKEQLEIYCDSQIKCKKE